MKNRRRKKARKKGGGEVFPLLSPGGPSIKEKEERVERKNYYM